MPIENNNDNNIRSVTEIEYMKFEQMLFFVCGVKCDHLTVANLTYSGRAAVQPDHNNKVTGLTLSVETPGKVDPKTLRDTLGFWIFQ